MDCLPDTYNYKKFDDKCIVRSNLKSKDDVENWVRELEGLKKETWTIVKTWLYKDKKQTRNVFKRIYKCHRKTKTNVAEAKKKTRNLNCPAELIITIKKFIPGSKSTISDPLLPDWPCIIQFKNAHNHRLLCVDNLSERPLGAEAKKNILQLFEKGHSVSSAYHTFCMMMMEELGNDYENQLLDRHNIPTKTDVQTLWRKHFKDTFGPRTGEVACGENPNPELFLPLQGDNVDTLTINQPTRHLSNITTECISINEDEASGSACTLNVNVPTTKELDDLKEDWKTFSNEILTHLDNNPIEFYPAISTFLKNREKCAKSNNFLISGLHNSFKYHGTTPKHKRLGIRKGKMISVQPTSAARRKSAMGGKKHSSAGRKVKSLLKKKAKAPHSLQECVNMNIGLGENKFKK